MFVFCLSLLIWFQLMRKFHRWRFSNDHMIIFNGKKSKIYQMLITSINTKLSCRSSDSCHNQDQRWLHISVEYYNICLWMINDEFQVLQTDESPTDLYKNDRLRLSSGCTMLKRVLFAVKTSNWMKKKPFRVSVKKWKTREFLRRLWGFEIRFFFNKTVNSLVLIVPLDVNGPNWKVRCETNFDWRHHLKETYKN